MTGNDDKFHRIKRSNEDELPTRMAKVATAKLEDQLVTLDSSLVNFAENMFKAFRYVPARVMRFHFGEVADVADMVAGTALVEIFIVHFLSTAFCGIVKRFENGHAVCASTTDVVYLTTPWVLRK